MKKSLFSLLCVTTFIFFVFNGTFCFSQQTGSFTKSFTFSTPLYPNQARTMAYFVPANYSASKKYKLFISLGGQGWAITSDLISPYGTANPGTVDLLKNASYTSIYGDFIAVSPSISPQATQAGAPAGTWPYPAGADNGLPEAIINEVKSVYNIDTAYVYLTGFSLGARGALTLGLESYKVLRGLILFTPAVQGLKEAKNQNYYQTGSNPMAYYDYAKAKQIPVCMTVGANDANKGGCSFCTPPDPAASYATVVIPEVNNQLIAAGAGSNVKYNVVAGLGHARPSAIYFRDCYNFIESQQSTTGIFQQPSGYIELSMGANPSCGLFSLTSSELETESIIDVSVYNLMGQVVFHSLLNDGEKQIDIRDQPDGLYFVEAKAGNKVFSGKLLLRKEL